MVRRGRANDGTVWAAGSSCELGDSAEQLIELLLPFFLKLGGGFVLGRVVIGRSRGDGRPRAIPPSGAAIGQTSQEVVYRGVRHGSGSLNAQVPTRKRPATLRFERSASNRAERSFRLRRFCG